MPNPLLQFGLLSFVSLFTMINPVGVIPVFTSMTATLSPAESRRVAVRATLTAFAILMFFALTGQWLFQFFNISVNSLRVVGGVIFFIMGYEMLQARLTRTQFDDKLPAAEYIKDISLTPLAIPVICGPGAITNMIILMNQSATWQEKLVPITAASLIMALTLILLLSAKRVVAFIGEGGNKVLLRLMGLIIMVIAVEFFFSGLKPIVRDILNVP